MAKKSAKSKGYRKSAAKKPYLTRRDVVILCAVIVVVAVGAILLFSYDDGALKLVDGKVAEAGENWVIVNGAASRGGRRYYKLAEAGALEGYEIKSEPGASDENIREVQYVPTDADNPVRSIGLNATAAKSERVASYYQSLASTLGAGEVTEAKAGDVPYRYFIYDSATALDSLTAQAEAAAQGEADAAQPGDEAQATADGAADPADAEAAEEPLFARYMHAYIDAPHGATIGVNVTVEAPTEADALSEEDLKTIVAQAIGAIRLEDK